MYDSVLVWGNACQKNPVFGIFYTVFGTIKEDNCFFMSN